MGISDKFSELIINISNSIISFIPEQYQIYLSLGIFIILITLYSIFVWKFYRFLAKRDLLELNLAKYNRYEGAFLKKFFSVLFFILEYIIILPVVVFFWFFVIAFILIFLAQEQTIEGILLISAVIVGSVRISAYYSEDLAKDLAKMFPFTILAVAILTPNFINIENTLVKIVEIPALFSNILFFLIAIATLEFVMRVLYLIMPHFPSEEELISPDNNNSN